MDGILRFRRGGRAGATDQPLGRDDGGLQRCERRLRALSDARARSGGGHRSPRLRGAEARLPSEDRQRRMDSDDEPDRAAGRQRRRIIEIARSAGRRRKLAHIRHQDLHHLWRARPDGQYHAHGPRPHAWSAGGHKGYFTFRRAEGAARRQCERPPLRFDRAQDGHSRLADLRDGLWRGSRGDRMARRSRTWPECGPCSR